MWGWWWKPVSWISLLGLSACEDAAVGPATQAKTVATRASAANVPHLAQLELQEAQSPSASRGDLDAMLRVESRAPGFAGYYLDESGDAVVLVKGDLSRSAVIRDAMAAEISRHRYVDVRPVAEKLARARIEPARYTLSELRAWERVVDGSPRPIPGLQAIGRAVTTNRVWLMFRSSAELAAGVVTLRQLGVPEDVVETWVSGGEIDMTSVGTWTQKYRPTKAGIAITAVAGTTTSYACSLGYNVTDQNGLARFLTASHCVNGPFTNASGRIGDPIYQPGMLENIGSITTNPAWSTSCEAGTDGAPVDFCTNADAMLGVYIFAIGEKKVGTSVWEGGNGTAGSQDINGFYPIGGVTTPANVYNGRNVVHKSGRMTGTTTGGFTHDCTKVTATVNWGVNTTLKKRLNLMCHAVVQSMGGGRGDSGGPVFARMTNQSPYLALGLSVAATVQTGTDVCNLGANCAVIVATWQQIEQRLGVWLTP